jgi:hypothetical protein
MPEAPTNFRALSILGTGAPLRADAADFGAPVAGAVESLGQSLGQAANTLERVAAQRTQLSNADWVGRATTQFENTVNKWMADPANNSRETFADELQSFHGEQLMEYAVKAPNKLARMEFEQKARSFGVSRYESALITSTRTQLSNMADGVSTQSGQILESYRSSRSIPDVDAGQILRNDLTSLRERIQTMFGTIAPATASKLDDQVNTEAIIGVLHDSPALARQILNASKIEGPHRYALENEIKRAEDGVNALNSVVMSQLVDNRVSQAKLGSRPQKFDLTDIQPYTSREHALRVVTQANAQIDAWNKSYDFIDRTSAFSGPEQVAELNAFEERAKSDTANASLNADILQIVGTRVSANIAAYHRDPAGYMLRNNPAIVAAQQRLDSIAPPPQGADDPNRQIRSQFLGERDALMLKYQSPPGDDETSDERKRHGVVPLANQRIISNTEAAAAVQRINDSSPGDALKTILSEIGQHPGREAIAFNNLVSIDGKPGLRGDYWMVYKNWKNPNVRDLIGALQNFKEVEKTRMDADKIKEFDMALDANPTWKIFLQTVPGDNFQNESVVSGYRSALVTYAMSQVQRGRLSPEAAVKKSVREWIDTTMAVTDVNGQKMLLDRDQENGRPDMTNLEAMSLGRRLGLATQFLDPKEVAMKDEWGRWHFPGLEGTGTEETKMGELRRYIREGFFKPSADGKSATFYFRGGDGTSFEARDKNGRAFVLDMANLPQFERYTIVPGAFGFGMGTATRGLESDPLLPSIKQVGVDERPGKWSAPIYTTNWPVEPKWMRREAR